MPSLDWTKKQNVQYAIPLWLRDEQIKHAISRVKDRIQAVPEKRSEPIAVACYGPSLNSTWEQIKDFKFIITCSGAHRFLIDRGIIPTWHVEVDPRAHKTLLIGQPHPDVEYLIASTCHPDTFTHLEGYKVKLWHVFSTEEEAHRVLPRGEWAVTGGCSVGLRALTLARFFGFTSLHVFGMDGSDGATGPHAAAHPNQDKNRQPCEYDGVTYYTTAAFLEAARQTWHELDQMPDVQATFYGEGLVQAMAKNYRPAPVKEAAIAYNRPELISSSYCTLNRQLHQENLFYGVGGGKHADTVIKLAESMHTTSVLDYGCGKGYLARAIPFPIWEYDPAVPGKEESPRPADLVVCTDVLEHIEPDKLIFVLDDLRRVTRKVGYFVIHTGASTKSLPDGRNTHLIQQPRPWWGQVLSEFFQVAKVIEAPPLLHVVVGPKALPRKASAA